MSSTEYMAPESSGSKKVRIEFYVSPEMLEDLKAIADSTGRVYGEMHRACWERGLSEIASDHTKILINKKTRKSMEGSEGGI